MPWTSEPSLITARNGLAAATADAPSPASGYRIYAIGGSNGTAPLTTTEAYDTLAKTWSAVAPMITARLNLAATTGPGLLYAVGGSDGTGPLAAFEIYDPAADAWSAAAALPTARSGLAAATSRAGIVYAIGGSNGADLNTVEAYDPTAGTWTTAAAMPTARHALAAVTGPDGMIYAIGGQNSGSGTLNTVEIYNPTTGVWSTGPSLPAALSAAAAAVGPDGLIYVMGGLDGSGFPLNSVYSYNPGTGIWAVQASMLTQQAFLAGDTGPDGLIYAIGGQNFIAPTLNTVEAFTVATASTAPDPYIGNGTYQSPDIVLLDSFGNPVPIGGAPGGAWDTLLQPTTNYGIQAVVYNDANIPAPGTIVGFWHFPGGVGTAGALIDKQTVVIPANGSLVVSSSSPFQSGGPGQHECVAVSVANPASPYFSVDPTTATAVIDPTIPHPAGSGHFGSAWRNTNSIVLPIGGKWRLPFVANLEGIEPGLVKIAVTATQVPAGWERTGEAAQLRKSLEGAGVTLRLPLFLLPEIRTRLHKADLEIKVDAAKARDAGVCTPGAAERSIAVHPGEETLFTVSGVIPRHTHAGDIFLIDVAAHYPATNRAKEVVVQYLEVVYVKG